MKYLDSELHKDVLTVYGNRFEPALMPEVDTESVENNGSVAPGVMPKRTLGTTLLQPQRREFPSTVCTSRSTVKAA